VSDESLLHVERAARAAQDVHLVRLAGALGSRGRAPAPGDDLPGLAVTDLDEPEILGGTVGIVHLRHQPGEVTVVVDLQDLVELVAAVELDEVLAVTVEHHERTPATLSVLEGARDLAAVLRLGFQTCLLGASASALELGTQIRELSFELGRDPPQLLGVLGSGLERDEADGLGGGNGPRRAFVPGERGGGRGAEDEGGEDQLHGQRGWNEDRVPTPDGCGRWTRLPESSAGEQMVSSATGGIDASRLSGALWELGALGPGTRSGVIPAARPQPAPGPA